jgi:hypothetical protein
MSSLTQESAELEVEQTVAGELVDLELPTEVYDSPTAAAIEEYHAAALEVECRLGGTWVEHT